MHAQDKWASQGQKQLRWALIRQWTCVCGMVTWWETAEMLEGIKQIYTHQRDCILPFSSVHFSRSVVSDSLQPHELQHARPPCPSPSPGVHSDSRSSIPWCHPVISSSVIPFSSCPQSLPVSESFPMIQLFAWGGQSTGASALASFLPKKSQGWSPTEWTPCSPRDPQESSPTPQFKRI